MPATAMSVIAVAAGRCVAVGRREVDAATASRLQRVRRMPRPSFSALHSSSANLRALFGILAIALPACVDAEIDEEPIEIGSDPSARAAGAEVTYDLLYTAWNDRPVLMLGNLDGASRALRKLEGGVGAASQAAVSPKGDRVAFTTFDDAAAAWDLRVLDIATRVDHHVAYVIGFAARPAWSPDGSQLAFVTYDDAQFGDQVRLVSADGGPVRALADVERSNSNCIAPHWSPDGTEIVYSAIDRIEAVRVADGTRRVLTPVRPDGSYCEPRWSPNGTAVAYAWVGWPHGEIARVARDGGVPTTLTPFYGFGTGQVRWSPSGKALAYVDYDYDVSSAALRSVPAAGGGPLILDHLDASVDAGHPQWSLDGSRVLYVRFKEGTAPLTLVAAGGGERVGIGLDGASIDGAYPSWLPSPIRMPAE